MYTEGKGYRVQRMYIQKVGGYRVHGMYIQKGEGIVSKVCIKKERDRVQCMYTEGREIGSMYVCRR